MEFHRSDYLRRALFETLPAHLEPYVRRRLAESYGPNWSLPSRDGRSGGAAEELSDLSMQIWALTALGPGRTPILRTEPAFRSRLHEVRQARNAVAHGAELDRYQTLAALGSVREVLKEIGADAGVAEVTSFYDAVAGSSWTAPTSSPEPASAPVEDQEAHGGDSPATDDEAPDPQEDTAFRAPRRALRASDEFSALGASDEPEQDRNPLDAVRLDVTFAPVVSYAQAVAGLATPISVALSLPQDVMHASDAPTGDGEADPSRWRVGAEEDQTPAETMHRVVPPVDGAQGHRLAGLRITVVMENEGTAITEPWHFGVDLLTDPIERSSTIRLDRTELLQMTSQALTTVRIRVESQDREREVTVDGPVVLAARQWRLRDSVGNAARTLATFVQPQQTELPELWRRAADHLRTVTGSAALNGYQESAERVDATIAALCEAIVEKDVAYSAPPTNWSDEGQRIRTAEEVLEGRLATCLDTTILMASALEFVDLQPLLLLLDGHAFLGYWKTEDHGPEPIAASGPSLINHIDRGDIGLVETTALTNADAVSPATLHHAARQAMLPDGSAVLFAVSVHEARERGVAALPVRGHDESGQAVEVSYQPAERPIITPDPAPPLTRAPRRPKGPAQVEKWKRQLLDLSLRNRLINCPDSAIRRHSIVGLAVPSSLTGTFEDLVSGGTQLYLNPRDAQTSVDDETFLAAQLLERQGVTTDLPVEAYDSALQKIAADTRTLIEETGANNLFLAVGSLVWRSGERDLRSPLILIPVELHRKSRKSLYSITLDRAGSSTPNFSLLERLAVDLGLQIPGLADPEEDAAGLDIDKSLDAVRQALIDNGLGFHVEPTVHLGLFKFGGFRLWKDLEESWEQIARNPLVRHLIETPKDPFVDPNAGEADSDLDELVSRLPIPADASQAAVVSEALAGHTMVVEGPPGTGKSQTITNLIVRAIADGRRVLFVAEKQAALEVVTRRLAGVGVGDLVLNLHDRDQRPEAVRTKLRRALDLSVEPDAEGIRAERTRLRSAGGRLRQYQHGLHDPVAGGLSYFSARTSLLAQGDGPTLRLEPERLSTLAVGEVSRLRDSLPGLRSALWNQDPGAIGQMLYLRDAVDPARLPALLDAVDELRAAFADAGPDAAAARTGSPDQIRLLCEALDEPTLTRETVAELGTPQWQRGAAMLDAGLAEFDRVRPNALAFYRPDVLSGPLDQVRADLVDAKSAMFGKARKCERALAPLAPYATGRPMTDDPQLLLAMADELISLRHRVGRLAELAAETVPAMTARWAGRWSPLDAASREAARSAIGWHREVASLPARPGSRPTPFQEAAGTLLDAADRRTAASRIRRCQAAARTLAEVSGGTIAADEVLDAAPVAGSREFRLKELTTRNEINARLAAFRGNGLDQAVGQMLSHDVAPADVGDAFERGLAAATLSEGERRASFGRFSPAEQTDTIDGYLRSTESIRRVLPELLIAQTLGNHRPALDGETARLATLRSEINRRRGRGRTIRSLFSEYGDLISHITPCVLVSPDSVARFIPADRSDFDLVVFDEASQITVASAVGAMGRGRAVVVCGDSHQMPPTSFAQLVRDDEFADEELADEESILGECVAAQVPRHWLSWHYRSRVESLIAFSNQHYYEGKLSSFPSPLPDGRDDGPDGYGILMHPVVDGQFIHSSQRGRPKGLLRTNPLEADAVVADIRRRFEASPDLSPSIGVVTFNAQQRDLIETRLRDLDDPRITACLDSPDGVFIKNLENVQGDERDVILFSVAFSADENGNVPLNFGPLNRPGGERRLNVAITRARRQVVMFCSFQIDQLHADRSRSVGLHHLKDYLRVAATGPEIIADAGPARGSDRHTDDIAAALRAAGLSVRTDAGMSDFRIDLVLSDPAEPEMPLVAVLLDGPSWNRRETVYDRDVLPTTVLAGMMGWPDVERVWLPEWLNDRDSVIVRLVASVQREQAVQGEQAARPVGTEDIARPDDTALLESPPDDDHESDKVIDAPTLPIAEDAEGGHPDAEAADGAGLQTGTDAAPGPGDTAIGDLGTRAVARAAAGRRTDGADTAADQQIAADAQISERLTSVTEFMAWPEHRFGERDLLDEANLRTDAREQVHRAAHEICMAEFPIQERRFHYLVARAFGLTRMQASRQEQIASLLRGADVITDSHGFVWPKGVSPESMSSHRRHQLDHGIGMEEIHPVEWANLVADVSSRIGPGASRDGLVRAVFAELGENPHRLTRSIRDVIEQGLGSAPPLPGNI